MYGKKQSITLLKGISCSTKSTSLKSLSFENTKVLSSDELRAKYNLDDTDNSVFVIVFDLMEKYLKEGYSVILDSTNLSTKRHNRSKNLVEVYNTSFNCKYHIVHPYLWESFALNRINSRWTNYSMEEMLKIRKCMFTALSYPFKDEFDNFELIVKDIPINKSCIDNFNRYYNENKELFLNDTRMFFKPLYKNGLLKKVFPELFNTYGLDQNNSHHNQTLDEHIFSVCENIPLKSEEMIWSAVLHDLGKIIRGIATDKEDGNVTYEGHAGASTEIAICVLKRFGFDREFIDSVTRIVNRHMYLPYVGKLKKSKVDKLKINGLYDKLVMFRIADKVR